MEPRRREEREGRREEEAEQAKATPFFEFLARDQVKLDARLEALAHAVIGAAIEVHRAIGPGLPESVYRNAMSHELTLRSIEHQVEAPVPVTYKGILVGEGRADLLVGACLVVELKTVENLHDLHRSQVIAYLSALNLRLGLLINFNVSLLADGIRRVIRSKA